MRLIRDLDTKPEKSKFAMHNDSKGGGGGQKPDAGMPTEAELRLIKDLQVAENDANYNRKQAAAAGEAGSAIAGKSAGRSEKPARSVCCRRLRRGQSKLPAEPDNRDQLPEEASKPGGAEEKVDDQELQQDLIGGDKPARADKPGQPPANSNHDMNLVGDRMARARQRLAMNGDPGPITQEIQKRILDNMDDLIEEARKKEAQAQNKPPEPGGKPQPDQPPKPDPGAKPENADANGKQKSQQPSQASGKTPGGGGDAPPGDASADIARQEARMWGTVTPRQRDAVIESEGEKVLGKYKNLVDDYYRTLSTKANTQ